VVYAGSDRMMATVLHHSPLDNIILGVVH
jgi:hypothetical protein